MKCLDTPEPPFLLTALVMAATVRKVTATYEQLVLLICILFLLTKSCITEFPLQSGLGVGVKGHPITQQKQMNILCGDGGYAISSL